ncbi:MAG TPA: YciI family protein [Gemmatimonadaceae bacterium]|nr:YciI family protein [Gemmatimonadaceae bacterium]
MRFMMLYKPGKESNTPPSHEEIARMGEFIEKMARSGVLIATDGLAPSSKGARVQFSNGRFTVTDGPFAEAKELIAGYAIVEASSKAEAIAMAKDFLAVVGEGESEVRQMHDPADFADAMTPELKEQEERWRAELASRQ